MRSRGPNILVFAAALAALVSGAARAEEVHRGSCRMDVCTWYSVEGKATVASNAGTTLFKVALKTWTSKHRGGAYDKKAPRVAGEDVSLYFACSKTKPAVVESADGKWTAAFLNLHNPPGFQELAVMEYFVVCHGFDVEHPSTRFDVAARKFGYRKTSDTPDTIELSKPEEILSR
jgi:hypothetical protein